MQLGELQSQIARFERRNAQIVAMSVDPADDSLAMIRRLGLSFEVGSDPNQRVIQLFRVQNPDTRELALHAVYIVGRDGEIFYRKVGLRRPLAAELIDAIDAHRGVYPQHDPAEPRERLNVAYPQNNFQALLEVSAELTVPDSVDAAGLQRVMALIRAGRSDDAVFAFRALIAASPGASQDELLVTAAWMTQQTFYADRADVLREGQVLRHRLARVRALEVEVQQDAANSTELAEQLARARAGLSVTRATVRDNARAWNLHYAKTMLRSYRELAIAGRPS